MKALWNMMSFFALVNLLALLLFAGWLWRTDRLDRDRLQQVREVLTPTIQATEQVQTEQARLEELARQEEAEAERRSTVRLASAAQVRQITRLDEQEQLARQRLADERRLLQTQIDVQMAALQEERRELDEEGRRRADADGRQREEQSAVQLGKAVGTLQTIPPKQARDLLVVLVKRGQMDQAVAYLDQMQPRGRARVVKRAKEQPELATELLEELRTLGLAGPGAEEPANAVDAANPL